MVSIREALEAANLPGESGRLEAELLLCHCLDRSRSYLYAWPEHSLSESSLDSFRGLLRARREGYPLAYLTGRREFWSLELEVDDATLIPRPETETLVEWALALELPVDARVADWGTGSGAIALALASERPHWSLLASDRSISALRVTARNCERLGACHVALMQADWGAALAPESLMLIVSNPPYIAAGDTYLDQGDIRFEPETALMAGRDGLDAIRRIVPEAMICLRPGGWLLLEHGYEQGMAVRELLVAAGLAGVTTRPDLAGHERVTGGRR
jgi:release factor glutamine methyltransferase